MSNEEIYIRINKWIVLTPLDERVCLLAMCKNWMKHQEDEISRLKEIVDKCNILEHAKRVQGENK